jgi:RNA polymerase sigma-70 factor, ECF subfamily
LLNCSHAAQFACQILRRAALFLMVLSLHDGNDFQAFYQRTHPAVLRYAAALCPNRADAEDVAAEAFLRAWRSRASFHGDDDARLGWVITIARNLVYDRRRRAVRNAPTVSLEQADSHPILAPDALVELREETARALKQVYSLPAQQRQMVILRHVQGWRVNQIAAHLGLTENTVSVNLRRAVQRLQQARPRQVIAALAALVLVASATTLIASPDVRASALGMLAWQPLGSTQPVSISQLANQATEPQAFAGVYTSEGPAASSPGRVLRIELRPDGRVIWSTDYRNSRPPIVERGAWRVAAPGRLEIQITGTDQRAYDTPRTLVFQPHGDALVAVDYDARLFGSGGVQVWRR